MSGPPLYLIRATVRRDAAFAAIAPILVPDDEDHRIAAGHRLVWSLFAGRREDGSFRKPDPSAEDEIRKGRYLGDEEARGRFLWHEEAPGRFLVLSPEPPSTTDGPLATEVRPFAPQLAAGDRLAFFLRCNPTASLVTRELKPNGKRRGGKRMDVVMRELHAVPGRAKTGEPLRRGEGRAWRREQLLGWLDEDLDPPVRPVIVWLARQGDKHGFMLEEAATRVVAYRRVALPREARKGDRDIVFGQADVEGTLRVTDPAAFLERLTEGFGRAKAFGCGLMLLKRADDAP